MIWFMLGVSVALNLTFAFIVLVLWEANKRLADKVKSLKKELASFDDLKDIVRDDGWGRINDPNPPKSDAVDPSYQPLVRSAGKRNLP